MLKVDNIWAKGRHKALFGRTSFTVERGEVILVQADSQLERTALALGLTGRLPLNGGTIAWGAQERTSKYRLRRLSDIIDSPEVTAPESHMRVHDYVSEMLSYSQPMFGRPRATRWLKERGMEDLDKLWTEEMTGEKNLELMLALAEHSGSPLLVFDTPSRHFNRTHMWLPQLVELAENEDNPRAIIAIVPHISESWEGKRAVVGDSHEKLVEEPKIKDPKDKDLDDDSVPVTNQVPRVPAGYELVDRKNTKSTRETIQAADEHPLEDMLSAEESTPARTEMNTSKEQA
ncbi:MAG: multidrug ABC transporter ATPase [Rothia sp. (in: high G+C Gram-positive bacteria)]|uniref:multidrug ABC transporter ATPase n=1 Tax=Rothia sp. (in: high G+C Gram-positive bacteria) TaxID=1885016 RepID=UPI0026DEB182|nr:multidrug ABC transporter ATPase [Rothia sp. (in: high G+C Gram-positive bacteria)]MDO5749765.1 multidrug ABC transporter ATPase [Rothia sp. (in: high G+C Gram-positive bacteria)]